MRVAYILTLLLLTLGSLANANAYDQQKLRERLIWRYGARVPVQWGMHLDGVVDRLTTSENVIALTFDACGVGGDGYDKQLIDFLIAEKIPATLFLTARWIEQHPSEAALLAKHPQFEIENHGAQHKPLSVNGNQAYHIKGTASVTEAVTEIQDGSNAIVELTGRVPTYFRSGTAHYDEIAVLIVQDLVCDPAGFSINGDAGATFSKAQVVGALSEAKSGDIVIMHMNRPKGLTFEGLKQVLPLWRERGFRFVCLNHPIEALSP